MALKNAATRLVKRAGIRAGLEAVALTRAGALWPAAGGRGVIFTLHHVRPAEARPHDPNALLSVTPQFLDEAIRACAESGLTPVALEDLPRLLADPADRRRFAAFTLDDGYRDNAEHAAPVFRRHGVPYTIFITKGFVERSRSAWWETAEALTAKLDEAEFDFGDGAEKVEMRTRAQKLAAFDRFGRFMQAVDEDEAVARLDRLAAEHGLDPLAIVDRLAMDARELRELARDPLARFGAHTLTHVNLRRVGEARLRDELAGSAGAVAAYVGNAPRAFAYPYGYAAAVGEREVRAAADAGFAVAVTTQPGVLGPWNLARPTAFGRVSLNGLYQKKRLVKALISGVPFKLM
ncbi:MAG TPA: polysaccharide deacetylase family protein [Mesorhizobium sp.]|nr:polysaccharide deacetylase family protein [Mesorhizobium sp.]